MMISSYRVRPTTRPAGQRLALLVTVPCPDTRINTKSRRRLRPRTLRITLRRSLSLPTSSVLSLPICRTIISLYRRDTLRPRPARTPMAAPRRPTTPLRHITPPPMFPRRHSDIPHIMDTTTTAMSSRMVLGPGRHRHPSRLSPQACHIPRTLQQERPHTNKPCPPVHLHSRYLVLNPSPRHMPLRATVLGSSKDMVPMVAAQIPPLTLPTLKLPIQQLPICQHIPRMIAVPTITDPVGQTHRAPHWRRHICSLLDLPG